jgi:hypothetical protein
MNSLRFMSADGCHQCMSFAIFEIDQSQILSSTEEMCLIVRPHMQRCLPSVAWIVSYLNHEVVVGYLTGLVFEHQCTVIVRSLIEGWSLLFERRFSMDECMSIV